jgi:hypothetical protein
MLGMFNILESYDLHSQAQKNATRTGLNMHRLTEAMKFAFGARTEISDPDKAFMDKARRERVVGFGKKEWAESVLRNLTDVSDTVMVVRLESLYLLVGQLGQNAHARLLQPYFRRSDRFRYDLVVRR